jgi:hypothetical protein
MAWLNQSALLGNYLRLDSFIDYYDYGLQIQTVITETEKPTGVEYPHVILGSAPALSLQYVLKKRLQNEMLRDIDSNVGLGNIQDEQGNLVDTAELKVYPQKSTSYFIYMTPIDPNIWALMRELADRDGAVTFVVSYSIPITRRPSLTLYGFRLWRPSVRFLVTRAQFEKYLRAWARAKDALVDVPGGLPSMIYQDVLEASRCLDIEASRAAAVMVRRALQGALIDKGADISKPLAEQIRNLNENGLLSSDVVSFAQGLRFLGNFGAHPNDDELEEVTLDDAKLGFQVVSKILRQLYP